MWFGVVSLFPDIVQQYMRYGIIAKAHKNNIINTAYFNPRDYTHDKYHKVDDQPYGGGPGMLMKFKPLADAIEDALVNAPAKPKIIYLAPHGKQFNHQAAISLSSLDSIICISGRYEGIDERIVDKYVDDIYSIGDYVLSGGELGTMVMIDAITRLQPNALGDNDSAVQDSFANGLLDYPHYTRPQEIMDMKVPKVLVNGNHKCILRWRLKQSLGRTWLLRPDLLEDKSLNESEIQLLNEYINEIKLAENSS